MKLSFTCQCDANTSSGAKSAMRPEAMITYGDSVEKIVRNCARQEGNETHPNSASCHITNARMRVGQGTTVGGSEYRPIKANRCTEMKNIPLLHHIGGLGYIFEPMVKERDSFIDELGASRSAPEMCHLKN